MVSASSATSRVLAIIPARGGSKGLPRKNIIPLVGKPLLQYSVEAARAATCVETIAVTSDDPEIVSVAASIGAETIVRPAELATDTATSEATIWHALTTMEQRHGKYDWILLLQPTSPLRTARDIDAAFSAVQTANASSVISVFEPQHSPYKSFTVTPNGYLRGLVSETAPFQRRQDFPTTYQPNGAIYLTARDAFERRRSFFTEQTIPYVMPRWQSIDIDTKEDIEEIERILVARPKEEGNQS